VKLECDAKEVIIMRQELHTELHADSREVADGSQDHSLRRLLTTARFHGGEDIVFRSVAAAPGQCRSGQLVVYRIGQDDPTQLIASALARGACGILTEQLLPCPLPQCIVGDTEIALAKVSAACLDRPDRQLMTIGVLGAAGKTTTSLLLASLLRCSGFRTAYQTDLGDCDGIVQQTSQQPPPTDSQVIDWLATAVETGSQVAIIELTDQAVRRGGYEAIEFDILIVAGGSGSHADFGPSALHCALDRMSDQGVVIAAAEDARSIALIRDAELPLLTYSVRKPADVSAKIIDQSGGMSTLMVTHQSTTAMMETALCGGGNAANHLSAVVVGLLLGQPLEQIVERLGQLREIPGRGQRLSQVGDPTVVIDVAGTPDRAAVSLRSARMNKGNGRLWCILAIDGADPDEVQSRYGTLIEKFAEHAIVTARRGTKSTFMAAAHACLDGVQKCVAIRLIADQRQAIQWAMRQAKPADTILILGGGRQPTAHQQRAEIKRLVEWVNHARPTPEIGEAVMLKIFK
jgi:UDP-N-acetylmuramoyl-L-alanyl-D-glutamate--2,6-diaminopimelate ligase